MPLMRRVTSSTW